MSSNLLFIGSALKQIQIIKVLSFPNYLKQKSFLVQTTEENYTFTFSSLPVSGRIIPRFGPSQTVTVASSHTSVSCWEILIFQIAFLCALIAIGSFRAKECRCMFAFPRQDKLSPSSQFVSLFACVVLKMLKILQVNLNSPLISERDVALSMCGCAMHELICINKSYRYFCQLVFFAVAPPSLAHTVWISLEHWFMDAPCPGKLTGDPPRTNVKRFWFCFPNKVLLAIALVQL